MCMCTDMCMYTLHLAYNYTQEMLRIMWQQQRPSRGHRNFEDSVPTSSLLGKSVHNVHQELSKQLETPGMMENIKSITEVKDSCFSWITFPKLYR